MNRLFKINRIKLKGLLIVWAMISTGVFFLVLGGQGIGQGVMNTMSSFPPDGFMMPRYVAASNHSISADIIPGRVGDSPSGVMSDMESVETPAGRSRFSLVNAAMALLATFDAADVLPPEGSAEGNQIIHAVIQIQAALVKSRNADLQNFVSDAIRHQVGNDWEKLHRELPQKGLSSRILEAVLTYSPQASLWESPSLVKAFQQFNVTEADWRIVETIFFKANHVYAKRGQSIHEVYESWRAKMA